MEKETNSVNTSVAKRDGELVIYNSFSSFPNPSNWSSSIKFHPFFAPVAHSELCSPYCDGNICPQYNQSHDLVDCGMVPPQVATPMPGAHLHIFSWKKKRNQIMFIYFIMVESYFAGNC